MPVFKPDYKPGIILRNGHLHTILAYFLRGAKALNYRRTTLRTPDNDFIVLDQLPHVHDKCAVLIHGLEGSAESSYITSLALHLNKNGWDIASINLRGCSGTDNELYNAYHSGIIQDLDTSINYLSDTYENISLIGFSLGGNIVLKYMGFLGQHNLNKVSVAAAVSVPCHLSSSSDKLETWQNFIYNKRFITSLKNKLKRKLVAFPGSLSWKEFKNIKTIRQFDDMYTGPANGFINAEDYYTKCSSLYSLKYIKTPTLLINAEDDPFLTEMCMPRKEAKENAAFHFYTPDFGGHVGFLPQKKGQAGMHEIWISEFLQAHSA